MTIKDDTTDYKTISTVASSSSRQSSDNLNDRKSVPVLDV